MTTTIKDVAARAGVSPKTVSRVMNGEQHVRPSVRDVVLRTVEELGYRPNAYARSLSSSRSYLIGLFFDDPASGYAIEMQRGARAACRAQSYHLLVEPLDILAPDWLAVVQETVRALRLDGVILPPPLSQNQELLDALNRSSTPFVLVSPEPASRSNAGSVGIDERHAALDMTRHLIALGHRDIGFVLGDPGHASSRQRLDGFTSAMDEAGLHVDESRVVTGDFSFRAGLEAGDRLLSGRQGPSAIFASNDDMALGVSIAAMKLGIAVPEQLSIAGFDDAATARLAWPPLTTVRQPVMSLGEAAVKMLVDPLYRSGDRSSATYDQRLDYLIITRESTVAPGG
jgi:LacI family transcriptional regulator